MKQVRKGIIIAALLWLGLGCSTQLGQWTVIQAQPGKDLPWKVKLYVDMASCDAGGVTSHIEVPVDKFALKGSRLQIKSLRAVPNELDVSALSKVAPDGPWQEWEQDGLLVRRRGGEQVNATEYILEKDGSEFLHLTFLGQVVLQVMEIPNTSLQQAFFFYSREPHTIVAAVEIP